MEKNAILFGVVDREDYWVTGGLVFKVKSTDTYKDAFNEIKHKLEAPEMVEYIIEDRCLFDDLFDGDMTFTFDRVEFSTRLTYYFKNSEGDEVKYSFSPDFVCLID